MDDIEPDRPLEFRTAELSGVSFPSRLIELVVTPYEQEAVVPHNGRLIREVFTRGAWDGIQTRPGRVKVNRDHDFQRACGKVVTFHPGRDEGLVAEIRVAPTPLGDETLALADEGILDASAGFRIMPGGESWHNSRSLRRVSKAWLHHIALTPDPAYTGAQVLAVRSAAADLSPPAAAAAEIVTPMLAELRAAEQVAAYEALDQKYGIQR